MVGKFMFIPKKIIYNDFWAKICFLVSWRSVLFREANRHVPMFKPSGRDEFIFLARVSNRIDFIFLARRNGTWRFVFRARRGKPSRSGPFSWVGQIFFSWYEEAQIGDNLKTRGPKLGVQKRGPLACYKPILTTPLKWPIPITRGFWGVSGKTTFFRYFWPKRSFLSRLGLKMISCKASILLTPWSDQTGDHITL